MIADLIRLGKEIEGYDLVDKIIKPSLEGTFGEAYYMLKEEKDEKHVIKKVDVHDFNQEKVPFGKKIQAEKIIKIGNMEVSSPNHLLTQDEYHLYISNWGSNRLKYSKNRNYKKGTGNIVLKIFPVQHECFFRQNRKYSAIAIQKGYTCLELPPLNKLKKYHIKENLISLITKNKIWAKEMEENPTPLIFGKDYEKEFEEIYNKFIESLLNNIKYNFK